MFVVIVPINKGGRKMAAKKTSKKKTLKVESSDELSTLASKVLRSKNSSPLAKRLAGGVLRNDETKGSRQ